MIPNLCASAKSTISDRGGTFYISMLPPLQSKAGTVLKIKSKFRCVLKTSGHRSISGNSSLCAFLFTINRKDKDAATGKRKYWTSVRHIFHIKDRTTALANSADFWKSPAPNALCCGYRVVVSPKGNCVPSDHEQKRPFPAPHFKDSRY